MEHTEQLARLPAVDQILRDSAVMQILCEYRRDFVVRWIGEALEEIREEIRQGKVADDTDRPLLQKRVVEYVHRRIAALDALGIRRVINATGVIVHTNLGRSPLPPDVLAGLAHRLGGYTNLEYDLTRGERGHRDTILNALLQELTGCEAATAVNNNAAAVLLILNTLARDGEVIVSRGELVEIGGSFRVPDIMRQSGAILREVGTTNRTRIADYRAAVTDNTRLILQVHRSNFEICGFSESPRLDELVGLSRETGIPLVVDAGSGYLDVLPALRLPDEPVIRQVLETGADLVCFSGDKLLGGAQAGLVLGRSALVDRLRRNPLMRVLRLDKLVLYTLTETLRYYFRIDTAPYIPIHRMMRDDPEQIRRRCRRFRSRLRRTSPELGAACRLVESASLIGGGSTPGRMIPGSVVAITPTEGSVAAMEKRLRSGTPPIISRVENDRLIIDLRTVFESEEPALIQGLVAATRQARP